MGFFDQMKQLQEMKTKADEVKKKLDGIEMIVENSAVKVVANGNRQIVRIELKDTSDPMCNAFLKDAINEVLSKADALMQTEMMSVTKGLIPGM